jgi:hypothetical protein
MNWIIGLSRAQLCSFYDPWNNGISLGLWALLVGVEETSFLSRYEAKPQDRVAIFSVLLIWETSYMR